MEEGKNLRVVTYNIHHGMTGLRKKNALDRMYDIMVRTKGDIFCIQENVVDEVPAIRDLKKLSKDVFHHHATTVTCAVKSKIQGNTIMSRYPFKKTEAQPFTAKAKHPRGFVSGTIEFGGKELQVICTHFGLRKSERLGQQQQLLQYVEGNKGATIIGGDFNDWHGGLHRKFLEAGFTDDFYRQNASHARTFPALLPVLGLDRLYSKGVESVYAQVYSQAGRIGHSDHLPVVVDYRV